MLQARTEPVQEQTWVNFHCTSCCWYSVWLRGVGGVGGVGGEVSGETIQTYPYSHYTFHHQNSQRVQTSSTLPTNLGKALANIIQCTCFFQHAWKQDRIHARTNMVKIALCKLFAGILCGCVVLLVLVVKWVKKPSKHIYILTALSTTRFNKEFKQVLPYQPTSGKSLGQHNPLYLFLSACRKPEQKPCKNKHGENCIAQAVVGILYVCVVLVVLVVKWVKKPSRHIYILTALSTNRFNKEFKQVLPYQPTSGKSLGQHHLLYVFLSACWKTGQDPCKNKHGENFIAQVWLVFCVVVWCRWCWWCWWWSEWWNHPNISIFSLHFSPPEFTKNSSKLYPRKSLSQHNPLYVFLSACVKTGRDPCKNKHGENCIVQVVCWYSVWLRGAGGVGGEVSEETIQTYLYSNCTFHQQI